MKLRPIAVLLLAATLLATISLLIWPVATLAVANLQSPPLQQISPLKLTAECQRIIVTRGARTTETPGETPFKLIDFVEIPAGRFQVSSHTYKTHKSYSKPIDIVRPFFISTKPITQWQFARVTGINPSIFVIDNHVKLLNLNVETPAGERRVRMIADERVNNFNRANIDTFLEQLNKWSQEDNPRIYAIIPGHIRRARIRLPTATEWEYAMTLPETQNLHLKGAEAVKDGFIGPDDAFTETQIGVQSINSEHLVENLRSNRFITTDRRTIPFTGFRIVEELP